MMKKDRFQYLLQRYFSGEITETEHSELDELLKESSNVRIFRSYSRLNRRITKWSYEGSTAEKKDKLVHDILKERKHQPKAFTIPAFIKYAAILVVLLGIGVVVFNRSSQADIQKTGKTTGITLHVSDTLVKSLGSDTHGTIGTLEGLQIDQAGDTIRYITTGEVRGAGHSEIEVPNGKTAVLVLSDDTRITLNSGTWLRFPRHIAATSTRDVYLRGEAFFEVSRDTSRPFIVHADDVGVRVLGTRFNVNNYESGTVVHTVLVEGKVALYNTSETYDEKHAELMHPGTLTEFHKSGKHIGTRTVDTDLFTAWTGGALIFEKTDFSTIVHSLERKFDMHIENHNDRLGKEVFTAKFHEEPIRKILESFRQSYPFEYTVDGNTIIIK
ncbi:FecR family protein [Sinomicrobium oceani]|uniref:FecR family protein n=1 Tax=Sinomicrobium oceani TaxID=1150368 RepID=UPI00227CB341|nr:FecR domain-containing protein [Sinomicrobium oceani]